MTFTIGLAQCAWPHDGDVVAGVELLVFPEGHMTRFEGSVERFVSQAQPSDGPFAQRIDAIAAREKLWIAYTMNEANPAGGLPYNTAIVTDERGCQRLRYRKVHLFDAQGHEESRRMAAGDALAVPLAAPFARIGLGICYDLRFPEVALAAALEGAQVMLYPASWVDGPGKARQWTTLLAARAIECGMFVAGVGACDEGRAGLSCVFAPDGACLAMAGKEPQLLVCPIDLAEVERVRALTPSLSHRRTACYAPRLGGER